uniref:Cytochrome P450 CYP340L1 n=1 Tax=Spodoptera frugiperda TaxID=7108 RepID=S4VAR8_SPOFR|nr:cytochrome P450 CYP340L1 [Spodoptera frugiperda]
MGVLVLALVFCVVFLTWCWRPRRRSPPKYPGALPVIGHVPKILKNLNDLWTYFRKICDYMVEHDGLISLQVGPHSIYVVSDPDDASVIANTCLEKSYHYKFSNNFVKNGLVTSDSATWKVHRKILNPAFSPLVLNTYVDEMNVQAQHLVSKLTLYAEKGPIDVKGFITESVLRLICRTSLGLKPEDQETIDTDYAKAIDEISRVYNERGFNVWLYPSFMYDLSALKRKEQELITRIENIINPVIQKRRSDLKGKYITNDDASTDSVKGKFKPLLDLLLHLADEEHIFSDTEIREHLDTFVLAANDTTSAVLRNTLLMLGTYPDVQERLYKEVKEVLHNEDLGKHDLTKLVYSEAVIKEVLRLHPPVPFVARDLQSDVVLPKYTLRAGNTCALSLYDLNRHSSWGPDAKEFNPDRWLNPDTLPQNPYAFAGFSIGKRNCIGKKYAMMTLKTSLAHIVRKFHISGDITDLKWKIEVVLKPTTPALVTLTLRS